MTKPDIASTNHGTIISIRGLSKRGATWMREHIPDARWDCAVDCEHRYGIDILLAALAAGLKLRDETSGVTVDRNTSEYNKYRTDILDPRD